jgi:hypothetical protein
MSTMKKKPSHPWLRDKVGDRHSGKSGAHRKALAEVKRRAKLFAKTLCKD